MERLIVAVFAALVLAWPQLVLAQAYNRYTSSKPGFYVEGQLGLNALTDIDFDIDDNADDATASYDVGLLGIAAIGYGLPFERLSLRVESEFSFRRNTLDEFEFANNVQADGDGDSATTALAGMVNAHLDYYLFRNVALSAGVGIGYALVEVDTIVEVGAADLVIIDEEDDTALAYQLRLGGRYDLGRRSTLSVGYTYFRTGELDGEDVAGNELDFIYDSHALHVGYAFRF